MSIVDSEAKKIVTEQFKKLPKDVQSAMLDDGLSEKIKKIGGAHKLSENQAISLDNETMLVLLGLEHPKDYIRNIGRALAMSAEAAKSVAVDVNKEVFGPVKESLKKVHGIGEQGTMNPDIRAELGIGTGHDKKQETKEPGEETSEIQGTPILEQGSVQGAAHYTPQDTVGFYPKAHVRKGVFAEQKTVSAVPEKTDVATSASTQISSFSGLKKEVARGIDHEPVAVSKAELPSDVKEAITSVKVLEQLREIGRKHNLHVDATQKLFDETIAVLSGRSRPKDYIRNLMIRLVVPAEKARAIAADVNEQIFKPIRESLKKVYGIERDSPEEWRPAEQIEISQKGEFVAPQKNAVAPVLPLVEIKPAQSEKEISSITRVGGEEHATELHKPEDLVQKKLEGTFSLPREESVHEKLPEKKDASEKQVPQKYEADPYRESIE